MPRFRPCLSVLMSLGFMVVLLAACASPSAYANIPSSLSVTVEPTESLETLEAYPTEGADPAATEYALAARQTAAMQPVMLGTPHPVATRLPIGQPASVALKPQATPASQPTLVPRPDRVNDLPFASFSVMDQGVIDHMREIYAAGQTQGRNPRAFSKAGDSTIELPYFLGRFDSSPYNLGDYGYLQAVIDTYKGSYGRKSLAVRIGQHSWTLLNPAWADKQQCNADESPLACEFRVNNPSVVILRLGANDAGVPKLFDEKMRAVVEYTIAQGVIPVLSTKPDQRKGTEQINTILRKIATDYQIPLWDFARVAQTLPGRGLGPDGVHLTGFYQHDYTLPQAFQRGHGMQNLTALIVLDQIWRALEQP